MDKKVKMVHLSFTKKWNVPLTAVIAGHMLLTTFGLIKSLISGYQIDRIEKGQFGIAFHMKAF